MNFLRPTHLCIDLKRLQNNYLALKKKVSPGLFLCPMIKANGYGHGDGPVAKALHRVGCEQVGVACVEEALFIQNYIRDLEILIFGFFGADEAKEIYHQGFTPVISNFDQLECIRKVAKKPINVHIKLNTGMNRLGFSGVELDALTKQLQRTSNLKVIGVCSHLHSGSDWHLGEDSTAQEQKRLFTLWIQRLGLEGCPHQHIYNSAAITSLMKQGGSLDYGLRPGLLVYGVDPSLDLSLGPLIGPVMSYKSKIVAEQQVQSGQVVSYGGTWRAPCESRVVVVPAGYGDGVSRSLSNKGQVLIDGTLCPIRGRVCMDYTLVDVTHLPRRSFLGEEVVFIGTQGDNHIEVNQVAEWAGRVNYEVMTSISERVPRHYLGEELES